MAKLTCSIGTFRTWSSHIVESTSVDTSNHPVVSLGWTVLLAALEIISVGKAPPRWKESYREGSEKRVLALSFKARLGIDQCDTLRLRPKLQNRHTQKSEADEGPLLEICRGCGGSSTFEIYLGHFGRMDEHHCGHLEVFLTAKMGGLKGDQGSFPPVATTIIPASTKRTIAECPESS
eukprot:2870736-Amphidinium_carterae.1